MTYNCECSIKYQYRIPDLNKKKITCFHISKDINANKTSFITHFVCKILYLTCNCEHKDRTNSDINRGRYYLNYFFRIAKLVSRNYRICWYIIDLFYEYNMSLQFVKSLVAFRFFFKFALTLTIREVNEFGGFYFQI